jgi:uncharacterized repeat protein (TIGR03803 family)
MKHLAISIVLLLGTLAYAGEKVLYTFQDGTDGSLPNGPLVADPAGNLYGTTYYGGSNRCSMGCGTVFELSPDGHGGWTETVLYRFTGGTDSQNPAAGLIIDSLGNLWGTTGGAVCPPACGSAFELSPGASGWTLAVLHTFQGKRDGGGLAGGLTMDAAGNLYGTSLRFGAKGHGTTFRLSNSGQGWVLKTLHAFASDQHGSDPQGSLIVNPAGTIIYGAASYGGADGYGVVYSLTLNSQGRWTEKLLHTFPGGKGGGNPTFGLSADSAGNLYGIATNTTKQMNLIYQLSPNSQDGWTERTIYRFNYPSSGQPDSAGGSVLIDRGGNAFGFGGGGSDRRGTIYELSQSGGKWAETLLYSFVGDAGGVDPVGSPIMDKSGNLYGVTSSGGAGCFGNGCGIVFEFMP